MIVLYFVKITQIGAGFLLLLDVGHCCWCGCVLPRKFHGVFTWFFTILLVLLWRPSRSLVAVLSVCGNIYIACACTYPLRGHGRPPRADHILLLYHLDSGFWGREKRKENRENIYIEIIHVYDFWFFFLYFQRKNHIWNSCFQEFLIMEIISSFLLEFQSINYIFAGSK